MSVCDFAKLNRAFYSLVQNWQLSGSFLLKIKEKGNWAICFFKENIILKNFRKCLVTESNELYERDDAEASVCRSSSE